MARYLADGQTTYEPDIDNLVQSITANGVIAGMQVTALATPGMAVQLAAQFGALAGVARYGGAVLQVAAIASLTIAAADATNARLDVVHMTSAGSVAVVTGTPSATPKPPALPAASILLGYVSVAAAASNVQDSNITDRRILLAGQMLAGLDASKPTFGNTGVVYFATDTNTLYRDSGTAWVAVGVTLDTTAPVTQAFSDAPAAGTAGTAARRDHRHGMPAVLSTASANLAADVAIGTGNTYVDGPGISLAAGTWLVVGTLSLTLSASGATGVARITDGTTHYASTETQNGATYDSLSMSALVTLVGTTTIKLQATIFPGTASGTIKAATVATPSSGNNASHIRAIKVG